MLLKDLKNTIRQSAVYGLSRVSAKLISFILLPLYSVNFSVSEYGIIVRIETLWQILFAFFLFGMESGIVKWYTGIPETAGRRKFLFSVTLFLLITNLIFVFFLYLASGLFSELIFQSGSYSGLIVYASLIAFAETMVFLIFLLLRINEKAFLYTFFSVIITVINLALQVYFILYTEIKLEGIFIAKIISPLAVVLILLPYYLKNITPSFDSKNLKSLIAFSFPVMLAAVFSTLLNQSDRYIIGFLKDSAQVGLYGLAYNICGVLNFFVIGPFSLAFTVISWKKLNDENGKRFFTKSVTYLFFGVIYLALILSLFTPELIKILALNKDYWKAKDVVPWIAVSIPFYGISTIGFFSFYVTGKTSYVLYFFIVTLVVNIILNFILISFIGMYGAAVANFISFVFLCILNYRYSRSNYFFKYEWKKIFYMCVVYTALVFPFFGFVISGFFLTLTLKVTAVLIFPVLLYLLNFYEEIELERINGFFYRYFRINLFGRFR